MRNGSVSRVGMVMLVGVVVLSVGVVLMANNAEAAPPTKGGSSGTSAQNWDTVLPADQRFTVLAAFNNEAVRDNETGLVWERSPVATAYIWHNTPCAIRAIGGRKGWRLPSIPELTSLIDSSVGSAPFLPNGHPFLNVQSGHYWSGSTLADNPNWAWYARLDIDYVAQDLKTVEKYSWCVRGGIPADGY